MYESSYTRNLFRNLTAFVGKEPGTLCDRPNDDQRNVSVHLNKTALWFAGWLARGSECCPDPEVVQSVLAWETDSVESSRAEDPNIRKAA